MKKYILFVFSALCFSLSTQAQEVLKVTDYRQKVLEYNQDIQSAQMQISAADEYIKVANSDKGPKIDAGASYSYTGRPFDPTGFKPVGAPDDQWLPIHHNYNANITIKQDLYTGGRVKSAIKLAQMKKEIATAHRDYTGSELLFYADKLYWKSVGDKESLELARQYQNSVQTLVDVAKNKYEAEIVSRNDLLMAEVKLNEAELEVLKAQNNYNISIMNLNRLMGKEIISTTVVEDTVDFSEFIFDTNDVVSRALDQRAEIKQSVAQVKATHANADLTASKYKGNLHVFAKGLYGAPSPQLANAPEGNYYAGAGFSIPIYHTGKKKRELAARKIETEIAVLNKEKITDQVILDINEARYILDEAAKRVELTNASLAKADENLKMITDRYKDGLSPIIEVTDAQVNWQLAYAEYIDAKVKYKVACTNIEKASGDLYQSK
ncbi:TolC family protein [Flammeovirga aprica]|uniref:TolC family protein n=1 Tax=Flammeovirga aprica JL-4 TaxID=694437 RepID=A0A7X9P1Z9_9BACT|nr:TolC family protein [Flammeovirga aprica]NME68078.1 TolC family protein [Flammeovirga aprica JL-4]